MKTIFFALFFAAVVVANSVASELMPLKVGETTNFYGPYCASRKVALAVGQTFSKNFMSGARLFNRTPMCQQLELTIKILNIAKKFDDFFVVEVLTFNDISVYLITNRAVLNGEPI